MIQIDDAGSGSLIGGTGIGILDTNNQNYYFDIIPLEYYQSELFIQKAYLDYVIQIVQQGFKKLRITKEDSIQVCPSYMFDQLRLWLTKENYSWNNHKIEGSLQEKVEASFNQYVISLGLPEGFIQHARFAFGFHRLLKWVFADLNKRQKLCKTGWKSWQKWGSVEKSIYKNNLLYPDFCLHCGGRILPPREVITIEYQTTKPATINLHSECFRGELNPLPPIFLRELKTKIKKVKHNLDYLYVKDNEQLSLKVLPEQMLIVNSQDILIGFLKKNLGNKLAFWINRGFNWDCQLIEENEVEAYLDLRIK